MHLYLDNTCTGDRNYPQNENSQRPSTSERYYLDARRPDRRTPMKVLVGKTFVFVTKIWTIYMNKNMEDLRCVQCITCTGYIHVLSQGFLRIHVCLCRPLLNEEEGTNTDNCDTQDNLDEDGVNLDEDCDEINE